jgi:hypothetical protein
MPLINFMKQFADDVKSGKKKQTIRKLKIKPIKKGDKLYLYSGTKMNDFKKLGIAVCLEVMSIIIINRKTVFLDRVPCNQDNLKKIIKIDGFETEKDFFDFFERNYQLPFFGQIIRWE